ncbi:Antigen MTB48 [Mycobacterium basiliense]|uniref:Antigen MTB48 n=1 Tax=Mycobacterium basiliense TaxID=2094119 RepID=A0A447G7X9_9MYCO|nr:hypothetical protein [Mycobacterium basiliense]VDM86614.1 Antigen MTB48 [Mycobacterium basiliense]
MTKPLNVQVVPEELMARAAELEVVSAVPAGNPVAPCALPMIADAAAELGFSADTMRTYLALGTQARRKVADALRQAAKSYQGTDEDAAQALNSGADTVSPVTPHPVVSDRAPGRLGDGRGVGAGATPPPSYPEVRQAAEQIAEPDQGTAFNAFAEAWTQYLQPLLNSTEAFRPFENWQGDAATAVEADFQQFRDWVYKMADMVRQLITQAQGVTSAQGWAITQHPTVEQLKQLDAQWVEAEEFKRAGFNVSKVEHSIMQKYATYQQTSQSVLAEYSKRANLPLPALEPPDPPAAYSPTPAPDPSPTPAPTPGPTPAPTPSSGAGGLSGMPMMMGGIPSLGGMRSAATGGAGAGVARGLAGGPALRPAALGGGAGGGMPLQSPSGADPAPSVAAAGDAASLGRANRGAGGAAAGRGGMGMAPVGHGGHGQSGNKGKREPTDDESLYTEDRAWTEAIIGGREPAVTSDADDWAGTGNAL